MKILNVHSRIIHQPVDSTSRLLDTLATPDDKMLALTRWPAIRLDKGLAVGSTGGHGPIRYTVVHYVPRQSIKFEFSQPKGFIGFHQFEFISLDANRTEIKHTINMEAVGTGLLKWLLAIRWLHDAFVEDAFDIMENRFSDEVKTSKWSLWVRVLRSIL